MKIIKKDGTIEEGVGISDEQAADMERVEKTLHHVMCKNAHHYDWQGFPKCRKVANDVALGGSLLDALEGLMPKVVPALEPLADVATEKEEIVL